MALVSYDSSDISDVDSDGDSAEDKEPRGAPNLNKFESSVNLTSLTNNKEENPGNLFKSLPKPNSKQIKEEDDEFLHKQETVKKEKTKIYIPLMSDFNDVEDIPNTKKSIQGSAKKSGLLSMLPEPKYSGNSLKKTSKPLIPNVVEKKIKANPCPTVDKPVTISTFPDKTKVQFKNSLAEYSDSDNEDENTSDFFSINSKINQDIAVQDNIGFIKPEENWNLDNGIATKLNVDTANDNASNEISEYYEEQNISSTQDTNSGASAHFELDDEAMRQLCGSRSRHKKEDINVINVNQQQVLSDAREWLVKGLMDDTTKRVSASKRKGNEPTSQQKRKHQITYLAHQAKANEAELQNQWANNRMSKRQTQSKYGF